MPFVNVKTSTPVPHDNEVNIKSALGEAIKVIPGKSEQWLMVEIEPERSIWFRGESEPAAMVEVSVFGGASSSAYTQLTGKICTILENELGIQPDRIYVKYAETAHWGWNGSDL